jgi:acetyl esterase/lipase
MPESNWVAMELAARGVSVLALDYRKALGGVTHPLPSDDVYAGWAAASDLLGILGDRLHLGGASAGATLSAGVVHRLLADTAPLPASLVLVYPVVHSVVPLPGAETAAAMRRVPTALRFSPAFMRSVNLNYVGRPDRLTDPAAFPAHGELSGFPPTLVINAEADDLRPSGEAFVDALELAGVSVDGAVESGTVHGYLDVPGIAASIASIDRIAARILELDRD